MKPASLAQLVERLTRNEKVASSILAGGSTAGNENPLRTRKSSQGIFCCVDQQVATRATGMTHSETRAQHGQRGSPGCSLPFPAT
jgi:hypothetical protein